ncbi:hypothetical protein SDC9_201450 [bioreactor metagenome]|uniref:Uncharacterized protein n=1 Tax=bioreactor metagenome TaxID=1076179 RepID=A0A645IZW4_9ZZZZ
MNHQGSDKERRGGIAGYAQCHEGNHGASHYRIVRRFGGCHAFRDSRSELLVFVAPLGLVIGHVNHHDHASAGDDADDVADSSRGQPYGQKTLDHFFVGQHSSYFLDVEIRF